MGIIVALLRIVSLVLIVAALMALGYDAFGWFNDHAHQLTSLQGFAALAGNEDVVSSMPGFLGPVFSFPAFLVLGVTGIVLAVIGKIISRD